MRAGTRIASVAHIVPTSSELHSCDPAPRETLQPFVLACQALCGLLVLALVAYAIRRRRRGRKD